MSAAELVLMACSVSAASASLLALVLAVREFVDTVIAVLGRDR